MRLKINALGPEEPAKLLRSFCMEGVKAGKNVVGSCRIEEYGVTSGQRTHAWLLRRAYGRTEPSPRKLLMER